MITIVDYGMGNLGSIVHTLRRLDVPVEISSNPDHLQNAEKIILPGVGSFDKGMENLRKLQIIPVLNELVFEGNIPILGICLGLQLFCHRSEEGCSEGLGWIDAETVRFSFRDAFYVKIPHMGWNDISVRNQDQILSGINGDDRFYFAHSYHLSTVDERIVAGTTIYGYEFPSIIQQNTLMGIQCHPERSHKSGMKVLQNFARL